MAGSTEIDGLGGGHAGGLDDELVLSGPGDGGVGLTGAGGSNVSGTGAVAGLAADAGDDGFEVEGEGEAMEVV